MENLDEQLLLTKLEVSCWGGATKTGSKLILFNQDLTSILVDFL